MNIRMYEIIEVVNPLHEKTGKRGIVNGMLAVDGDIVSYSIHFADGIALVDPEDVESTGGSIPESDYEKGAWSPDILSSKA